MTRGHISIEVALEYRQDRAWYFVRIKLVLRYRVRGVIMSREQASVVMKAIVIYVRVITGTLVYQVWTSISEWVLDDLTPLPGTPYSTQQVLITMNYSCLLDSTYNVKSTVDFTV